MGNEQTCWLQDKVSSLDDLFEDVRPWVPNRHGLDYYALYVGGLLGAPNMRLKGFYVTLKPGLLEELNVHSGTHVDHLELIWCRHAEQVLVAGRSAHAMGGPWAAKLPREEVLAWLRERDFLEE